MAQNSGLTANEMQKSPIGRPFEKGRSGNPGGRPRFPDEFREMARASSDAAFRVIIELMVSTKTPPSVRLAAANAVLDRAYGRPTIPVTTNFTTQIEQMSDDELLAFVREETLHLAPRLGLTLHDARPDTRDQTPRP